jgi:hypothetical protein
MAQVSLGEVLSSPDSRAYSAINSKRSLDARLLDARLLTATRATVIRRLALMNPSVLPQRLVQLYRELKK